MSRRTSVSDDLGDWAKARAAKVHAGGAASYVAELLRPDQEYERKLAWLHASPTSERDAFEFLDELCAGLRRSTDAA